MNRVKDAIVDILCEFIEVAIHVTLHSRSLYPPGVFKLRQKYGAPVHICFHPDVSSYVTRAVTSLRPALASLEVKKVAVDIRDITERTVERIVIEVNGLSNAIRNDPDAAHLLEQHLRSAILKLGIADSFLRPVTSGGRSWQLVALTESVKFNPAHVDSSATNDFHWILENGDCVATDLVSRPPMHIVPLKSLRTDFLQVYAEEYD